MNDDFWLKLSERLNGGDAAAAEELFVCHAPYLRMVVRRQLTPGLRSRFDSNDVVQSVWTETLSRIRAGHTGWVFRDAAGLRSFLARMTRNHLIDLYRRHRASLGRERGLSTADARGVALPRGESPSEVAQAGELWALLLRLCPPAHHELLRLKAAGAPLAEIAERTGLHEGSVRRILYTLAERLGNPCEGEHAARPAG